MKKKGEVEMDKKLTQAEYIATYLVQNYHYCPIDEEVSIADCEGWKPSEHCVKCILKHSSSLNINLDYLED